MAELCFSAARWNTTSTSRHRSTSSSGERSARSRGTCRQGARRRLQSPERSLSRPITSAPAVVSASTRGHPMNPAAPVTSARVPRRRRSNRLASLRRLSAVVAFSDRARRSRCDPRERILRPRPRAILGFSIVWKPASRGHTSPTFSRAASRGWSRSESVAMPTAPAHKTAAKRIIATPNTVAPFSNQ